MTSEVTIQSEATIQSVEKDHDRLYAQYVDRHLELMQDGDERQSFIKAVDSLIENIKTLSTRVKSLSDYTWLSDLAMKWQPVFLKLNIPGNIQLLPPTQELTLPSPVREFYTEEKLNIWLRDKAYYISKDRKDIIVQRFRDLFLYNPSAIMEIVSNPNRIFDLIHSSIEREESDWLNANVHLATYILSGAISFTTQIGSDSYWRLEREWLDDVKKLKAYFDWLNQDNLWYFESAKIHFDSACKEIRQRLIDKTIKGSQTNFGMVKDYLEKNYLKGGKINLDKNAKELIGRKAYRLYQKTGQEDSLSNWIFAEKYVRQFYENIIPAVVEDNHDGNKTLAVLQAVHSNNHTENTYLIINCFEAALCIYFLKAETIEDIWEKSLISKDLTL